MNVKLLKPLVMMQLKDKIDLSFLKTKKQTISKIVLTVLLFVAVTAFVFLLLMLAKRFNVFSLINHVPVSVMAIIFTFMLILSTLACTYGLMKSLYFSKDNIILLTFPVTANMVFLSKLIVFYIYEIKRTISFLLPLFIAYGIVNNYALKYFAWIIVGFIIISAIPVALGALLSIPCMLITQFLRNHFVLQGTLFAGFLFMLFYSTIKAIAIIPANINIIGAWGTIFWRIQDILTTFKLKMSAFYDLTTFMVGEFIGLKQILFTSSTVPTLLTLIGGLAVVVLLSFLLAKPLFFKMSSKPFEYKRKIYKKSKPNVSRNKLVSSVRKEFILNFRTTELIATNFLLFAVLPIAIFLLNKIYAAMNTSLVGNNMTLSFNILMILLITLSSNYIVASAFSKEGASGYLIKTKPASYHISLISKLVFNATTITISLIVTTFILKYTTQIQSNYLILMFFCIWFVYLAHLVWSAEMDIMNPQNHQYATTGSHANNPNENKSSLFAFLLAFLFFGMSLFLFSEGVYIAFVKLALLALALMIFRMYLFSEKIKVYFREVA